MMLRLPLSTILDFCLVACGKDSWQVTEQCNLIAWAYEVKNYFIAAVNGQWVVAFYAFCNLDDAERIMKTQSFLEGAKVLMRKQVRGDVIFPFLVCGNVLPIHKSFFMKNAKTLGAKKMIFFKTKRDKFYLKEV